MNRSLLIEIVFTTFVVFLIVFPIPPSTIIGVALATNPRTGRYMNRYAYIAVKPIGWVVSMVLVFPVVATVRAIENGRMTSGTVRVRSGNYLL